MRAVLWRPSLIRLLTGSSSSRWTRANALHTGATLGEVLDLKDRSRSLELVSMINGQDASLEYQGEVEHVEAARVSDNFLPLLGERRALGRTLTSRTGEDRQQV